MTKTFRAIGIALAIATMLYAGPGAASKSSLDGNTGGLPCNSLSLSQPQNCPNCTSKYTTNILGSKILVAFYANPVQCQPTPCTTPYQSPQATTECN